MDQSRAQVEEAPKRGVRRRHDPDDTEAHPPKFRILHVVNEPCSVRRNCDHGEYDVVMRRVEEVGGNFIWQVQVKHGPNHPVRQPVQLQPTLKRSAQTVRRG